MATFTLFPIVFVFGAPGLGRETGFLILSMLAKVGGPVAALRRHCTLTAAPRFRF